MRLWLCLLGLSVPCFCSYSDQVEESWLDLRTAYRKYLPDEWTDVPDPKSDESKSINVTAILIKRNRTDFDENWSERRKDRSYPEDSDISESRRRWLKQMNFRTKDEYSWECNSSEYREFQVSLEKKLAIEANRTDVFEDDIDDLWDMYMANKTAPPNFPLAYSPRFMCDAYRKYSLAYYNITIPTTKHWLLEPLTGSDGIHYDRAMERIRKYNISKNDPVRIGQIERYIEHGMKGKDLNRSKDIVRHFISLKRKMGVTLNWTIPPYSISKEVENMKVPDTVEVMKKFEKGLNEYDDLGDSGSPDFEKLLKDETFEDSLERTTTQRTTKKSVRIVTKQTEDRGTPFSLPYKYEFPQRDNYNPETTPEDSPPVKNPQQTSSSTAHVKETPQPTSSETPHVKETPKPTSSEKPLERQNVETKHSSRENLHVRDRAQESSNVKPGEREVTKDIPQNQGQPEYTANPKIKLNATESALRNEKILHHPAVKFLRKHKNKFLIGGIVCLAAAKIIT
ncbi:hypothetical protein M8J76_001384 [Diaphorina citri]|nr:hypothetical protein M8J76_001384 [Diaphorina citri]